MFHEGQMVYAIVTDHPDYPKVVYADGFNYAVFADETVADNICAAWNSYYINTNTPQPWPFYVLQRMVVVPNNGVQPTAGGGAANDVPLQMGLFD